MLLCRGPIGAHTKSESQLAQKLAPCVTVLKQAHGARQEIDCGRSICTFPGADTCAAKTVSRRGCEFLRVLVSTRELRSMRVRLLEMEADDLVRIVAAVEIVRHSLVE